MKAHLAVIPGDGIGPEIVNEALRVLDKIAELYGHTFHYTDVDMGGCAIDKWGDPLPQEMLDKCVASDSVLLGAVGGDKWNDVPGPKRPEKGLLRLRAGMGVYSNNRPAKIWPQLSDASPLKKSIVEKGIDFIIVRELIGGIYFGEHKTDDADGQPVATDIMKYSEAEIERIGRIGFETARKRNHRLCSVEKSNVLDTSRLWKKVMHRLAEEYTDVELTDMLVDNCAMQIVKNPAQFDVIVTENMFGDILSDEASMITGSRHDPVLEPRCDELRPVRADPRLCTGHCGSGPCKPDRHHSFRRHDAALQLRYGEGSRCGGACGFQVP